jgi:hypothetical protein
MYETIMYNQSGILASRPKNMQFQSVFAAKLHFSVKPKANPFWFWAEIWIFFKTHKNIYIRDPCV